METKKKRHRKVRSGSHVKETERRLLMIKKLKSRKGRSDQGQFVVTWRGKTTEKDGSLCERFYNTQSTMMERETTTVYTHKAA